MIYKNKDVKFNKETRGIIPINEMNNQEYDLYKDNSEDKKYINNIEDININNEHKINKILYNKNNDTNDNNNDNTNNDNNNNEIKNNKLKNKNIKKCNPNNVKTNSTYDSLTSDDIINIKEDIINKNKN